MSLQTGSTAIPMIIKKKSVMDQSGEVLLSQALYEMFRGFNSYVEVLKYFDDIKATFPGRIDQFGDYEDKYFAYYMYKIVNEKKSKVNRKESRESNREKEKKYQEELDKYNKLEEDG